ncbi:MAG: MltA domain-containing protein, partial [Deltaproteobacteria bacterium]|nr:MltA domain-containing protein [Deltaproteobacteria bacterium]
MKYKQKMQYVSCSDFSTQGHWPSGLFLLTCVSLLFFSACSQNYPSADNLEAGANASSAQKIQNFRSLENFRFIELEANKARALATKLDPSQQGLINWNGLRFALQQSLTNVSLKPVAGIALTVHAGNAGPVLNVSWGELRDSMLRMLELLPYLDENPGLLADEFRWLELAPEFGFTGYYEPTLLASHRPRPPYTFPLYSKPKNLRPDRVFYDRHAIDRQNILAGRGLELAWVRDELEAYFLQVQGSGRLLFPDGKTKHVLYAGKNGRPYVSLGAILRDKGLLDPDNISMSSIKNYLLEHPKEQAELLDMNPSYVFFRLAKAGPIGSMGSILTPKVSLA